MVFTGLKAIPDSSVSHEAVGADAEDDADAGGFGGAGCEAGVLGGFLSGGEREVDEGVGAPHGPSREVIVCVEVLDGAGEVHW
ncbi:hypothetical protein GCM10018780_12740 [Streptomyces lanatus]|nr:hypothetical protein GCM10018780_12740 [Streptomyces lanatus]